MNNKEFNQELPVIEQSNILYQRATGLIPAYTQTLAKGPTQHVNGVLPKYLRRGQGAYVWDVDGNEYLDFQMAIGPLSLGYAYPAVDQAIRDQLEDGITFSLMHPLEVEVAELIRSVVPNVESVRYSKTGADVTSAAIRLARAFTGRDKILCCGYHGWHDWYIGVTDRNAGIPGSVRDLSYTIDYNNLEHAERSIDSDTAAVILEPMVFEEPREGFLAGLREICTRKGVLLIFDEMWTGFRIALGGAQQRFGVRADLVTFSKAIANGMPLSVLAGRQDVMKLLEEQVFFFTTFGGEVLSLAAAQATIRELGVNQVPAHLARLGQMLKNSYNQMAGELKISYTKAIGMDARTMITFDGSVGNPLEMKSFVQQELCRRRILWSGFHNLSYSHKITDIQFILKAYEEILPMLDHHIKKGDLRNQIHGEVVAPVFRRTTQFNVKPGDRK